MLIQPFPIPSNGDEPRSPRSVKSKATCGKRSKDSCIYKLFYSPIDSKSNGLVPLPIFTFAIFFSAAKQACGPEVPPLAGLRGKSIGGKRIPPGDPTVFPQNEAGPPGNSNSECGFRNGLLHLTHVHSTHFSKIQRMRLADIKNDFPLDP